jgi:predicted dehydrogenase
MVRIGMLGCGFLATFYMQGLSEVPNQQVVVVYGRDKRGRALQANLSNLLPVGEQKREQNY